MIAVYIGLDQGYSDFSFAFFRQSGRAILSVGELLNESPMYDNIPSPQPLVVDLIWSKTCPNVEACKEVVRMAIDRVDCGHVLSRTWEVGQLGTPAYAMGYTSPTVLVNGRDVVADAAGHFNECCRVYATLYEVRGVPLVEEVVAAILRAMA